MGNLKTRVCCVQCGVSVDRAQERARHVDCVRTTAHGFIPVLENGEVGERLHDGAPCLFRRLCFVEETEYSIVFPVILLDGDGPVFVSLMVKMPKSPNYRLV